MKTKYAGKNSGFTIVEVMIVLAVTTLLFISIAMTISGKQQHAEFDSAIRDVQAQIQQIINQTGAGYYPAGDYTCAASGDDGSVTIQPDPGHSSQGQNSDCVFLGNALHFSDGSSSGGDAIPSDTFLTYPIAGLASATGTFDQADPTIIDPTISKNQLQYGLHVIAMNDVTQADTPISIGSFAIVQSLGKDATDNPGALANGAQSLELVVPNNPAGDPDDPDDSASPSLLSNGTQAEETALNSLFQSDGYDTSDGSDNSYSQSTAVTICFASGSTNQSGLITVGNDNNSLSVELKVFDDNQCGAGS